MTLLAIPAPVDPHVHLRDLEWSYKATAESETAAALAGGYWAVLDMPNAPPPTTTRARLRSKAAHFEATARCDFGLYLGADQAGNEAEYAAAAQDAVGLKMYCDQTTGQLLVGNDEQRRAHLDAWGAATTKPLAVHAEGATLDAIVALARGSRTHIHFCHVSTADEIETLRAAKQDGLPFSVGVTPHHLFLTDADAARLGPYGLVKPEIRSDADVAALWAGIADGTIDVIESDHAPHTRTDKEGKVPLHGLPGLETTLPLMVTAVHEGRLSEERLIELVATNAQRLYGLAPPPETMTLIDREASYVIADDELLTAPGWSPFAGMRVRGRVREVRIDGVVAFDGERVIAAPGSGRNVAWS